MTAPAIASSSADVTGNTSTDISVDVPAGTVDGDLLILIVAASRPLNGSGFIPSIATPSGWTLERSEGLASSLTAVGHRLSVYSRTASSEPANYAVTATPDDTDNGLAGKMLRITGHNGINAKGSNQSSSGGSSFTATGITTTVNECLILYLVGVGRELDPVSFTTPDATEQFDFNADPGVSGNTASMTGGSKTLSNSGATGNADYTLSGSASRKAGAVLAIAPELLPGAVGVGGVLGKHFGSGKFSLGGKLS